MFGVDDVAARFGAPVLVGAPDAAEVTRHAGVAPSTFTGAHALGDGFELVPTPGHTPGTTAFLWEHGGHRFLFTGDTVYLRDGEWVAAVRGSSDRAAYVESLLRLRDLDFDVLVPWAASAGQAYVAPTDAKDARRRLSAVLDRVWSGEDH